MIDQLAPSVWLSSESAPSIPSIRNYISRQTSLNVKSMRLFDLSEIEDLSLFVNKHTEENPDLSDREADAANTYLRKNSKFYLNSHLQLLSEKYPSSCYINISLKNESYSQRLKELLKLLQAPYTIFLARI